MPEGHCLEREALCTAASLLTRRSIASYQAAIPREAAAASTPLPVDTEDEWEEELQEFRDSVAAAPACLEPVLSAIASDSESVAEEPWSPGVVPEEWQQSYAASIAGQPAFSDVPPPAACAAAELFSEIPFDTLTGLLELHSDGIPVSWPAGLDANLAAAAIRSRR